MPAIHVQMFGAALASWVGAPASMCIFSETCGTALALGHNGGLYSCDQHIDRPMRLMAGLLHRGRYADEAMAMLA